MSECPEEIQSMVWDVVHSTPVVDIRCFVHPPEAGCAHVSGVDALLCSKQILREFFRSRALASGLHTDQSPTEESLQSLSPGEIADLVWRRLFLDSSPLSEPARTVLTTFGLFGMPMDSRDLGLFREKFAAMTVQERVDKTFAIANLEFILYPVAALDMDEQTVRAARNPRFRPVLSLDALLGDWKESARKMRALGYGVKGKIDEFAPLEVRRFLQEQLNRLNPIAVSYSWPPGAYPESSRGPGRIIRDAALPLCRERNLPLVIAPGNAGGDSQEHGAPLSVGEISLLWRENRDIDFLLIPTESQQLAASCREASECENLLLCGPDAPLSHPASLPDFTAQRLETCGNAFHFAHSGAVSLEELAGRWAHLRWILGKVMMKRYAELWRTGWRFSRSDVEADVKALLGGNARKFLKT